MLWRSHSLGVHSYWAFPWPGGAALRPPTPTPRKNQINWNFPFTGTSHLLERPIQWKSPFTGSPHLLEVHIYWNFPFTGTSHLLEVPIYWNFSFTGTSHALEHHIHWKSPFTGTSDLLEVRICWKLLGWGGVGGPCSFPHGMPQKWSSIVSVVLVLDPVMLVMPTENLTLSGF